MPSGRTSPGCLVLDVRLPGMSGLDFQSQLAALGIHLPVILMTGHGDIPMSVRAMKAGAVDFLPKPFRDQDLLDAVTTAIERDRRRREVDGGANVLRDRFLTLSPREQQVMTLVTTGKMNKQVAGDLGLERDNGKDSSRCSNAQNGRANARRPGPHGRRVEAQIPLRRHD